MGINNSESRLWKDREGLWNLDYLTKTGVWKLMRFDTWLEAKLYQMYVDTIC